MYKRYENSLVKKTRSGKRYLSSTSYPPIPIVSKDIYIITKKGDRLDVIAYLFYKDVRLWWIIAQANHVGKGSFYIEPGFQLRIPMDLKEISNSFKQVNS